MTGHSGDVGGPRLGVVQNGMRGEKAGGGDKADPRLSGVAGSQQIKEKGGREGRNDAERYQDMRGVQKLSVAHRFIR